MGELTTIQWCNHTFNPWRGCAKVHEGCTHCYAETLTARQLPGIGPAIWGPHGTRVIADNWNCPRKWNRVAEKAKERHRVFCASLADVFEDWKGPMINLSGNSVGSTMADCRRMLFHLIDETPQLDWQLLTKRPEHVRQMWPSADIFDDASEHKAYWRNVWIGASVSLQSSADKQIPQLLKLRDLVPTLFLSAEPLLGPITGVCGIDWVIVGGESGRDARPCDVAWVRSVIRQCKAADVACFVKQLGSFVIDRDSTAAHTCRESECWPEGTRQDGQRILLKDSNGGDPAEWPADLRVRLFP